MKLNKHRAGLLETMQNVTEFMIWERKLMLGVFHCKENEKDIYVCANIFAVFGEFKRNPQSET